MKFTYKILIALLVLTSCSNSDEDSNNSESSLIIGTWVGVSSTWDGNPSGVPDNNIVKFTSDNRTEFIYEGFGNNGEDISETGSWTKSNNTLTITWDEADAGAKTYVLTITELNNESLTWETVISGEGTLTESFVKE